MPGMAMRICPTRSRCPGGWEEGVGLGGSDGGMMKQYQSWFARQLRQEHMRCKRGHEDGGVRPTDTVGS